MNTVTRSVVELDEGAPMVFTNKEDPENRGPWTSVPKPRLYEVLREWKTDDSRTKGSRRRWNPFSHYKCDRASSSSGGNLVHTIRSWYYEPNIAFAFAPSQRAGLIAYQGNGAEVSPFGEPAMPLAGLPDFGRQVDGYPISGIPAPDILERLKAQSLQTMFPVIKAELSVVNSILELKDFKSLPQTIARMKNVLSKAVARVTAKKKGRKGTLRSLFQGGADGYLQQQFNILPLLSDISGIHAALSRTQRRINDFVTRAGRVQTRHFAYNWQEFGHAYDEGGGMFPFRIGGEYESIPSGFIMYTGTRVIRHVHTEPTTFHAELQYNYNYTAYQVENAQLLGHLDAFGVNLNPSIIWNAVPWTFVIDWVIGIGPMLDRLKRTNMEPQVNILNYLWSVRRSRRIQQTVESVSLFNTPGVSPAGRKCVQPVVTETSYRRDVGIPATSLLLQTSGLSSRELSLAAALVITRRRRRS